MTSLVLIRHGPTDWNAEGRIQGRSDRPLSAAGRASVARWRLPAEPADRVWIVSPLKRARQTAELLNIADAAVEEALIEADWGAWEGERLADLRRRLGAELAAEEARGLDFTPPGGESPRDLQRRLAPLLRRLAAAGRATGAVTHKGVIRALYAQASGWHMRGKAPQRLVDGMAHVFRLDADARLHVERLNLPLAG